MLRFLTAGESHGRALVVIVEGLPAGLPVATEQLQDELARRRLGYGRGPRMRFEQDEVAILGGVRHGRTLGSPVAIGVGNSEWDRDPDKWQREMSVRSALGASRGRLVRQLLVESLLMAAIGGLIGLGLAKAGVEAFDMAVVNAGKPSWIHFTLEYSVLGYCLALCVLAAVVSGLVPALRSSRVDLTSSLKEGGRSGTGQGGWFAGTLVVAQFTLALVLVAGATLMIRSLLASRAVNGDMPRQEVMTARVALPNVRYGTPEARLRFFDDVLARLARIPGAAEVAVLSQVPGLGEGVRQIEFEGVSQDPS